MKERLRSSQSSNRNEEPLQRSQYESPRKMHSSDRQGEGEVRLGEQIQYKLEKVFQQAGNREQRYINLIKEQEQRMNKQSERYLQTLREIKKQFLGFMAAAKNERQVWRPVQSLEHFSSKGTLRLNSIEFSQKTIMQYAKQEGKTEPELHCKIHCYYYTPFAQDCLRFQMPEKLILRVRGLFGGSVMERQVQVIGEEDPADNLNCLLNRVPFQITTGQNEPVVFQFTIPCSLDAISHYRRKEVQVELVNSKGLFLSAYGKLNMKSLLYYQQRPTEWQLRPLPVFSPLDGSKVGELSLKLGNRLELRDRQDHYRVQSSTPMELAAIKAQVNYNDDESRMIQRISKFKSASHSLLLGIGATRDARPQKIFEQESDKTVLMHRQKKELESILQYKNSHKGELMEKLFNEAIERYYLTDCEVATPKMVYFTYRNNDKQHRKIIAKIEISYRAQGKTENAAALALAEQIQTALIGPKQTSLLYRNGFINLQQQAHTDYEFDQQEQSLWAISGMAHLLTVKVLCPPLKTSLISALNTHYELKLNMLDQYGQLVESFHTKLKLRIPAPQSTLHAHGYVQTQSQLQIPFDEEESAVKKSILTDLPGLQYSWNSSFSKLSLRINHQFAGQRSYYLIVNDQNNLYTIARYQIIITSYPRLAQSLSLQLGEVRKVTLEFMLTEQMLTQIFKEVQNMPVSKPRTGKDQIRVFFISSRPQHCVVSCEDEPELICKLSRITFIQRKHIRFKLKFKHSTVAILKKYWCMPWISIETSSQNVGQMLDDSVAINIKGIDIELQTGVQAILFYSSNLSIMTVPQALLVLLSNQRSAVELEFTVRHAMSAQDVLEPVKVILTVTDGSVFNNYLFELNVRIK